MCVYIYIYIYSILYIYIYIYIHIYTYIDSTVMSLVGTREFREPGFLFSFLAILVEALLGFAEICGDVLSFIGNLGAPSLEAYMSLFSLI